MRYDNCPIGKVVRHSLDNSAIGTLVRTTQKAQSRARQALTLGGPVWSLVKARL